MSLNPANWNSAQFFAAARNIASALGGAAVAFGLITATQSHNLIDSVNQIGLAVGQIAAALGVIVPIVAGLWASKTASPANQAVVVAAQPGVKVELTAGIAPAEMVEAAQSPDNNVKVVPFKAPSGRAA